MPPFLYQPPQKKLRAIGDILSRMPLPDDPRAGAMHRMPMLQWQTWVRLAFVQAGSDWRSLNRLAVENGFLKDYGIAIDTQMRSSALGVLSYDHPAGAVIGESYPTNGAFCVADPVAFRNRQEGFLGVHAYEEHAGTVRSRGGPTNGAFSVADPHFAGHPKSVQYGVKRMEDTASAVTTKSGPGQGAFAIAAPQIPPGSEQFTAYGVTPYDRPSAAITSQRAPGQGRFAVADPTVRDGPRGAHYSNVYRVVRFEEHAGAVTAGNSPSSGGQSVADPRYENWRPDASTNKMCVIPYDGSARCVTGAQQVGSGALAVADPVNDRGKRQFSKYHVAGMDEQARTVIAANTTGEGAYAVADPSPIGLSAETREHYLTGGHYGVVPWEDHAGAISAHPKNNNGPWSVADRRPVSTDDIAAGLPNPKTRLVAVIRAEDATWHRPFTTLELAALQSLLDPEEQLELDGLSDTDWRERIGNAIPPDAAEAVATVMGKTILMARSGHTFSLSNEPIWVQPIAVALSVDRPDLDTLLNP